MKLRNLTAGVFALSLMCTPTLAVRAQMSGQLGNATASGPVLIDGETVASSRSLGSTARVATGSGGSVTVALSGGGEVRLDSQSDAIISAGADGPRVHLLCGKVTVTSASSPSVMSATSVRVSSGTGTATISMDGKSSSIKEGKSRDVSANEMFTIASGSTAIVESTTKCDCNCTNP